MPGGPHRSRPRSGPTRSSPSSQHRRFLDPGESNPAAGEHSGGCGTQDTTPKERSIRHPAGAAGLFRAGRQSRRFAWLRGSSARRSFDRFSSALVPRQWKRACSQGNHLPVDNLPFLPRTGHRPGSSEGDAGRPHSIAARMAWMKRSRFYGILNVEWMVPAGSRKVMVLPDVHTAWSNPQ